jgi:galactoside O-acetyltransferase
LSDDRERLRRLGLVALGEDVRVHETVQFFGADRIRIGSHVRIDCFSVISAGDEGLHIGDHVHLGVGVAVLGRCGRVELQDFCGLSPRVTLFTASDDFKDGYLTGPTVPDEFRKVTKGPVTVGRHVIVGSGTVILPGVHLGVGVAIGALSLVAQSLPPFTIAAGAPLRRLGVRNEDLLRRERELLEREGRAGE